MIALLRYNSHTIKFAHLKWTVQWFLVYSQHSPLPNVRTFSSPQKETPCSLALTSCYPSPIHFPSLWILPFLDSLDLFSHCFKIVLGSASQAKAGTVLEGARGTWQAVKRIRFPSRRGHPFCPVILEQNDLSRSLSLELPVDTCQKGGELFWCVW